MMLQPTHPKSPKPWLGLLGFGMGLAVIVLLFLSATGLANNLWRWQRLGVAAVSDIPYNDLWAANIHGTKQAQGIDPYHDLDGCTSIIGNLANYPPLLLRIVHGYIELTGSIINGGKTLIIITLLCFGALSWGLPLGGGFLLALGLGLGGPAMALERGNTDLMLVPLLLAGAYGASWGIAHKKEYGATAWLVAIVCLCFSLKLFPIAAMAALLALPTKQSRWIGLAACAAFLGVYLVTRQELIRVLFENTPTAMSLGQIPVAYGIKVLTDKQGAGLAPYAYCFVALVGVGTGVYLQRKKGTSQANDPTPLYALALAGAAIFCSTYLVLFSFNYRLIFLVLILPFFATQSNKVLKITALLTVLFTAFTAYATWVQLHLFWGARIATAFWWYNQGVGMVLTGVLLGWVGQQTYVRLLANE
jgi:hypothetical protein